MVSMVLHPLLLLAATTGVLRPAAAAASSGVAAVSPVQKVIQLLIDMEATAKEKKNAEAVGFAKFKQFCDDKTATKADHLKRSGELMESLTAEIAQLEAQAEELSGKVEGLNGLVAKNEADLKQAQAQRKKDAASSAESIEDLAESVDALDRAIQVLKKQDFNRQQSGEEALLQLSKAAALTEKVQRTVAALMQLRGPDEYLFREGPQAHGYEFQSSGLLDLLKNLYLDFKQQHTEALKGEMNSKHAHEMVSQDLHSSIEGAKADIVAKTAQLEEKKEMAAENKRRLDITKQDHEEDTAYLKDLTVECDEKSKSFDEKQGLRAEEIKAIGKAVEILSSEEVSGAAEEHLPSLVQRSSSLAQLRAAADRSQPGDARREVEGFLRSESRRLQSGRLGMLAEKVSKAEDPFTKVKQMIEDMIKLLLKEANHESEQKGFCDRELGTNKQTRDRLQSAADALAARMDEGQATIAELSQRIGQLAQEISELQTLMQESSADRTTEKTKNEATISDAASAQRAVRQAMEVLRDFYSKAGSATALLQVEPGSEEWEALGKPGEEGKFDKGHRQGMQTFGKTYTGRQAEADGVFAMLEVIQSDFATLEAATRSSEAAAVDTYEDLMRGSKKSVAVKEKESEMLSSDRTETEASMATAKKDLASTQDELLAANRYYDSLKPQCVDTGITYEKRAKARDEEIQSLKEALDILKGKSI